MATYKEIKGVTIQTLDSDPVEDKGTFSTGGDLNSGRSLAAAGDKTAGLGFGGYDGPPNARIDLTEKYDGTSWSEVNELNAGRYGMVGFGTQTAAIGAGGYASPPTPTPHRTQDVESWNGTNWTEVAELNSDMRSGTGFGTATAGYVIGGVRGGSTSDAVESWNGSSWTETTEINTARAGAAGAGITTAGLIFGGTTAAPAITGITESWNGSAWTETSDMPTAADSVFGGGTSTLAAAAGGSVPSKITTLQLWDGSNWTTNPTGLAGQRSSGGTNSSPTQGNLLVTGGTGPGPTNYNPTATEELSFPEPTAAILTEGDMFLSGGTSLKVFGKAAGIPSATFSSGASMSTNRNFGGSAGLSADDNMRFGGFNTPGPTTNNTEIYNGTSWTEVNELNTSRAIGAGWGTTTASVGAGGFIPPSTNPLAVESWNGTSWSEVNEINNQHYTAGRGGVTSTAAVIFGGLNTTNTEVWNGTSFTEVNNMNTAGGYVSSFGTSTSAIAGNRYRPGQSPAYTTNEVESWDGTSWTEVNEMNTARAEMQGFGASGDSGVIAGGSPNGSSQVANTEFWNGTSFTELADLSTARANADQSPSAASGMVAGGYTGTIVAVVEEWNADLTLSTVTVS